MEGERSPSSQELGRDSPFSWAQLPSSMLADSDWFGDEHIQAKRARVETIIRGMCVSPNPLVPGNAPNTNSPCCPEKSRERKRKQSLPIQQGPLRPRSAQDQGSRMGSPRVREQLHLLKQQLQHLQEHILQSAKPGAHAQGLRGPFSAQQRNGCSSKPRVAVSAQYQSSNKHIHGAETHKVAEGRQQPEEPGDLPSAAQALLEILRKEVITVVAQAVDAVFQKVVMDLPDNLTQRSTSCQGLVAESRSEQSPPEGGGSKDPLAPASLPRRVQPQAGIPLESSSLTKPLESPKHPLSPGRAPKPYQGPPGNCSFTVPSYIQENQVYNQLPGHGPSGHWSRGPPQDSSSSSLPSAESAQHSWVLNQHHLSLPFMAAHLESLPLPPSVKTEQNGLQTVADTLPFSSIHEGLHPGHLKKAKLMFFYTRYPSSNLLKAYFPDVQFNRCITSQMIKWFSNFREFYYIQMEKSARQAISDGVTNPKMLVLLRDSELFRALNMHYNKGNDLEVPDCFLEVASLTLQEFFRAVVAGKDSDPSWKKPIYKIISKLDSNIPEIFKSPSYPQELFHN